MVVFELFHSSKSIDTYEAIIFGTSLRDILSTTVFVDEPVSQYGNVGSVATFICTGETGNDKAGVPTVNWYSTTGGEGGVNVSFV